MPRAGICSTAPSSLAFVTTIFTPETCGDPLMDIAKARYYFKPQDKPEHVPKRAGLLAGYGDIALPDCQATVDLYRLSCTLELWCWRAQFGGRDTAELTAELESIDWR